VGDKNHRLGYVAVAVVFDLVKGLHIQVLDAVDKYLKVFLVVVDLNIAVAVKGLKIVVEMDLVASEAWYLYFLIDSIRLLFHDD
jgi:hypothetical protein